MDLILLSGESTSNKEWIESVEKNFADLFETSRILHYDHWASGNEAIDFKKEYSKLPALVQGIDEYFIFAKSIGTVLVARGIFEKVLVPKKCILVGSAWLVGERNFSDFKKWVENFSVPTLFITKVADPVAPADKLRDLLEKYHVKNYKFVEIPGDNHKYEDLEKIKSLTKEFLVGNENGAT